MHVSEHTTGHWAGLMSLAHPDPRPLHTHQHGPKLHAARELQTTTEAQGFLQVLLTGLGNPYRHRSKALLRLSRKSMGLPVPPATSLLGSPRNLWDGLLLSDWTVE